MGRIAAPFGVQGWFKVQPFTAEAKGLLGYKTWWAVSYTHLTLPTIYSV